MNNTLIDGRPVQLGDLSGHDKCKVYLGSIPVADHTNSLRDHVHRSTSNFKLITGGHVYILNYDPSTYKGTRPTTYEEYREMKKNNEKLNFTQSEQ